MPPRRVYRVIRNNLKVFLEGIIGVILKEASNILDIVEFSIKDLFIYTKAILDL